MRKDDPPPRTRTAGMDLGTGGIQHPYDRRVVVPSRQVYRCVAVVVGTRVIHAAAQERLHKASTSFLNYYELIMLIVIVILIVILR